MVKKHKKWSVSRVTRREWRRNKRGSRSRTGSKSLTRERERKDSPENFLKPIIVFLLTFASSAMGPSQVSLQMLTEVYLALTGVRVSACLCLCGCECVSLRHHKNRSTHWQFLILCCYNIEVTSQSQTRKHMKKEKTRYVFFMPLGLSEASQKREYTESSFVMICGSYESTDRHC